MKAKRSKCCHVITALPSSVLSRQQPTQNQPVHCRLPLGPNTVQQLSNNRLYPDRPLHQWSLPKRALKIGLGGRALCTVSGLLARVGRQGGSGRNTFSLIPGERPVVWFRPQVLGCKDLLAKDKNGFSDPLSYPLSPLRNPQLISWLDL